MKKWALLLMVVLSFAAKAQNITVTASDKDIVEILRIVEKQARVYFSYDPALFVRESKKSVNYRNSSLQNVLADLLGSKYQHEKVGEYIVISLRKNTIPLPLVAPATARSKKQESVVTDTVIIEKVIYVYDTQRVVLTEKVFDTVRVNKTTVVYDTVHAEPTNKKFAWAPYVSFFQWTGSSRQLRASQIYSGMGVGLSREFTVNKRVKLKAGIQYSQQFQNIKISGDSTGAIAEDSTAQKSTSRRVNQLNMVRLQSSFTVQVLKPRKALAMDVEIGFSMYKAIKADEIHIRHDGGEIENTLRDYGQPFYNITMGIPLSWHMNKDFSLTVLPFVEWGLNKYKINDMTMRTSVVGVAVKFKCF